LNVDSPLDGCRREWKQADKAWGWAARFQLDRVPADFVEELVRVPRFRSVVSKHRYDGGGHPEVEGAPRRAGRRLGEAPPQAVDLACWYKWSLPNDREPLGHYLGDDPSNWRRSFKDRGNRPAKWKAKPWKNWNRKPRPSVSKGSIQFNGFRWRCPVCGKECKTVYLPTPPVNLLEKVQPRIAQCVDVLRKVKGFACGQCHGVRNARWEIGREWNAVVSYLSGGLLYGREVKRPEWFSTGRQNAFAARLNARPAARRMRVGELMAAGWTARQIAAEMEVKLGTVYCYAWRGRRERADEVRGSRDGRVSEERFSRVE
jgi:hypothetical protein